MYDFVYFAFAPILVLSRSRLSVCLLFLVSSCGPEPASGPEQQSGEFRQWKLPASLREISGLALTPDERLLAITDEKAVVYELDYQEGRIIKSFAFGNPVVRADFEGIAVLQDRVWLMTSDGLLFAASEGPDGRSVNYQKFDTGHGSYCELEGLAQDSEVGTLILACKEANSKGDALMIFEWSVSGDGIDHLRDIAVPQRTIAEGIDKKRINPSGVAIDPRSGEWVLVAARQKALFRLTTDGKLSEAVIRLKKSRHRQAEGIEMTRDGRLLIADEGGDSRARLAVYQATSPWNHSNE